MKFSIFILVFGLGAFSAWCQGPTVAQCPLAFAKVAEPSSRPLFAETKPITLKLEGDFDRIHKANAGGNWTGEERDAPEFWTDLVLVDLADPEKTIQARARARGMSSAQEGEASFPKMRVEIPEEQKVKGTAFQGSRKFRLNTHVATDPSGKKRTEMGRLNDERSPFREAMAYEMAQAMGLPTPAFRRATIEYTDRGLKRTFVRNALILDTDKKTAERFGASLSETFPEEGSRLDVRLGARFHLFHALIGNDDAGLKLKNESNVGTELYRPFFNTFVLRQSDGSELPVVYDLDLSTMISGSPIKGILPSFEIKNGVTARMATRIAHLRSRLSQAEFNQLKSDVADWEPEVRKAIKRAVVDEAGRRRAYTYLAALKAALGVLEREPMLLADGLHFYRDKAFSQSLLRDMPLSEGLGTLRPGTTVKVLAEEGDAVKVAIIDAKNDLLDWKENIGYVKKSELKLGFDLPDSLQGKLDERDFTR